jgi:phage gp29-like protein
MVERRILGPNGQPISRAALSREEAVPAVTGLMHPFDETIAPGLSPARLARTLRDAGRGEMRDFLTLAEEMEEREPQYRYLIETRKNGVTSLNAQVDPASESARDVEIADFLRDELVSTAAFQTLPDMMVDGLAKGYSQIEMVWETGSLWLPRRFIWRDPRLFQFDLTTRSEFRLRMQGMAEGVPLTPLKFLSHVPLLKMGLPARNGLARCAVWGMLFKSFSMRDWAEFLDIYGMPLRLGKYGPGSSDKDRAVLLNAVRNLGRDAAAIIPQGMEIEFVEAKGFSDKPFEAQARFIDEQLAKLIIGKPGDGTASSKAGEETLDRVRIDIKKADARDLELTLAEQLIRPLVDLNFGPQKRYPRVHFPIPERKDLAVWADAVAKLADRGLAIEQSQLYDVLSLKEPAPGAKLLAQPVAAEGQTPKPKPPPQTPAERASAYRLDPRVCPTCGPATLATADGDEPADEEDRLVATALADWRPDMQPVIAAITEAASAARSFEEFEAALEALAAGLPIARTARRLAVASMIGRVLGDQGVE